MSLAGVVHVKITSSNIAYGQLISNTASASEATVDIPVGSYYSPMARAAGGAEFDPVAVGMTTVSTQVNSCNNTWTGSSLNGFINR